jgi:uncharacterized damage-inducible protein DinB
MKATLRSPFLALTLVAVLAAPGMAQQPSQLATDLLSDVGQVEKKLIDLARAIPEDKFGWRPSAGVRSVGEVVLHVASDNYLIPAALGYAADPATGIKGDDYNTALTFEKRKMTKAEAIAELEKSFAHFKKSLGDLSSAKLAEPATMFGQRFTMQQAWILGATHLHEHLGQLIAYARSNNVKPPWSQGG